MLVRNRPKSKARKNILARRRTQKPVVLVEGRVKVAQRKVPSLLDAMVDGNEYGSIVPLVLSDGIELNIELQRAIAEVEKLRGRPCICYVANQIKRIAQAGIVAADHLPFNEMVAGVPAHHRSVDVFLSTPGGSADQVNLFVEALRKRFDDVQFIIPYKAMSAGTLWAVSGDAILMDSRSFLGPLDPQVPTSDGTLAPAQSLLILLSHIQKAGAERLAKKEQPDWTHVQLLRNMEHQKLGQAVGASQYVIEIAAEYLERFKFRTWVTHKSSGVTVTPEDRKARAADVAAKLCDHARWKAHGHAISREVLWDELKIQVEHLESTEGLQRAVRRAWALWYYLFDKMPVAKAMVSQNYTFFRFGKEQV